MQSSILVKEQFFNGFRFRICKILSFKVNGSLIRALDSIQDESFFGAAHRWDGGQQGPPHP